MFTYKNNFKIHNYKPNKLLYSTISLLALTACNTESTPLVATITNDNVATDTNDNKLETSGNNIFLGSAEVDIVDDSGIDTVNYSDSPEHISITSVKDTLIYGLVGDSPTSQLISTIKGYLSGSGGFADGDRLYNIDNVIGSPFNDYINGSDRNNIIDGGDGEDTINGYGGEDIIYGGKGDDTISGGSGNDKIYGGEGDDFIHGTRGDNFIEGGPGADEIKGGQGYDTASYVNSKAGVSIFIGLNQGLTGGDAEGDKISGVEKIIGSNFNDQFSVYYTSADLFGSGGNDTAKFSGGAYDFTIEKEANNIIFEMKPFEKAQYTIPYTLNSIETLIINDVNKDMKTIWNELSEADHNKFDGQENNFLTWLGDDAGYNYEGL